MSPAEARFVIGAALLLVAWRATRPRAVQKLTEGVYYGPEPEPQLPPDDVEYGPGDDAGVLEWQVEQAEGRQEIH